MPDALFDNHVPPAPSCERCDTSHEVMPVQRCSICGYWLCAGCFLLHQLDRVRRHGRGDQPFCHAVAEVARLHLSMRLSIEEDEQFEEEFTTYEQTAVLRPSDADWVFAHAEYRSSLRKDVRR